MDERISKRVDANDEGGLLFHVRCGDAEAIERINNPDEDINVQDRGSGRSALMCAVLYGQEKVVEEILKHRCRLDVGLVDDAGCTALHYMVKEVGYLDHVLQLMELGADPVKCSEDGVSPLFVAARVEDNISMVKALFEHAKKPDLNSFNNRALPLIASLSGSKETTTFLLGEGASPFTTDDSGLTAFHHSVWKSKRDMWMLLSQKYTLDKTHEVLFMFDAASQEGDKLRDILIQNPDLDINANDIEDQTVLHLAALANLTTPALLNHKDLEVDALCNGKRSCLDLAAEKGNLEFIKAMFNRTGPHPQLELKNEMYDNTPLATALKHDHREIVKFLVAQGADVCSKDSDGDSTFYWALGDPEMTRILVETTSGPASQKEVLETFMQQTEDRPYLVDAGIWEVLRRQRVSASDRTALSLAAGSGYWNPVSNILDTFLEVGEEGEVSQRDKGLINHVDEEERTALSWAAQGGHVEIVKLLTERRFGAEVDRVDGNEQSPLAYAAINGHFMVVQTLLERGASRMAPTGRTLLGMVSESLETSKKDFDEIVDVLAKGYEALEETQKKLDEGLAEHRKALEDLELVNNRNTERQSSGQDRAEPAAGAAGGHEQRSPQACQAVQNAERLVAEAEKKTAGLEEARAQAENRKMSLQEVQAYLQSFSVADAASKFRGGRIEETFRANILYIRKKDERSTFQRTVSVSELLSEGSSNQPADKPGDVCKWVHLPANNVSPKTSPLEINIECNSNANMDDCYR